MSFLLLHLTLAQVMVPWISVAFIVGIKGFTFQTKRSILLLLLKYKVLLVLILKGTSEMSEVYFSEFSKSFRDFLFFFFLYFILILG